MCGRCVHEPPGPAKTVNQLHRQSVSLLNKQTLRRPFPCGPCKLSRCVKHITKFSLLHIDMLRVLICLVIVCVSVGLADVNKAWARFRQKKYTSFVVVEGVGDDGEPIETIEDTVSEISTFL